MIKRSPYSPHRLTALTAVVIAAIVAGCAADGGKSERRENINDKLVILQLEKNPQTEAGDCAVSVRITNRMRDINWDGVSYQVALLDKKNVTRGRLVGAPRHYTRSGQYLDDSGKVLGARCEDLVGVSVIYFGYYPPGKRQASVHLSHIRAEIR